MISGKSGSLSELCFHICKRRECQLSGFIISNYESMESGLKNFTTLCTLILHTDPDSRSGGVYEGLYDSGYFLRVVGQALEH